MLNYSLKVKPVVSLFFRYKNDVDIFVEDRDDYEFYNVLLNRIIDKNKIKISKIISLGCKQEVINACIRDQEHRNRKRLYIVDGDLDYINNNNPSKIKHLFVHNCYCVENYLIDEGAIVEILHDLHSKPKNTLRENLGFQSWLSSIAEPLINLFLHYAIAFELQLSRDTHKKTVANGVGNLCSKVGKYHKLDLAKVNDKIEETKNAILSKLSKFDYLDLLSQKQQIWDYSNSTLLKITSGKTFILPLLFFHISTIKDGDKITKRSLRLRLAKLCSTDNLRDLSRAIKSLS